MHKKGGGHTHRIPFYNRALLHHNAFPALVIGKLHRQDKILLMSTTSLCLLLSTDQTQRLILRCDQDLPHLSANLPLISRVDGRNLNAWRLWSIRPMLWAVSVSLSVSLYRYIYRYVIYTYWLTSCAEDKRFFWLYPNNKALVLKAEPHKQQHVLSLHTLISVYFHQCLV